MAVESYIFNFLKIFTASKVPLGARPLPWEAFEASACLRKVLCHRDVDELTLSRHERGRQAAH